MIEGAGLLCDRGADLGKPFLLFFLLVFFLLAGIGSLEASDFNFVHLNPSAGAESMENLCMRSFTLSETSKSPPCRKNRYKRWGTRVDFSLDGIAISPVKALVVQKRNFARL